MPLPSRELSPQQVRLLEIWAPGSRVVADHSWGLTDTVVVEIASGRGRAIVKAGGPSNHHIDRELRAHQGWTRAWVQAGRTSTLLAADAAARILLLSYLPGCLVEGDPAQDDPGTFHQAGQLLSVFHAQAFNWHPTWRDDLRAQIFRRLQAPAVPDGLRRRVLARPPAGPAAGPWQSPPTAIGSPETG